ncbi:hypothetical protein [Nostoc sp. FACHB-190]|uniref:hypothetical protein n=1 Tax=Nostoc sp. FACHB-190 TaxID=2692838 RepID=UPI001684039C|nr:hypothetical protein [Nostoc sp. FACHB-190]MBD2303214.1 hypothetical protein [Nostoc sp. FACHB-190]
MPKHNTFSTRVLSISQGCCQPTLGLVLLNQTITNEGFSNLPKLRNSVRQGFLARFIRFAALPTKNSESRAGIDFANGWGAAV